MTTDAPDSTALVGRFADPPRRCPRCRAHTLINDAGDEWCSYVSCTWGFDDG